ncbi:MAG: hypothetical protein ACT4QD_19475 [Acidobacteriota bacterium]
MFRVSPQELPTVVACLGRWVRPDEHGLDRLGERTLASLELDERPTLGGHGVVALQP